MSDMGSRLGSRAPSREMSRQVSDASATRFSRQQSGAPSRLAPGPAAAQAAAEEAARLAEERQRFFEDPAVHTLQAVVQGWKVRRAMRELRLLEDLVLRRPTPGPIAVERCIPTPRPAVWESEASVGSGAFDPDGLRRPPSGFAPHRLNRLTEVDEDDDDATLADAMMAMGGLSGGLPTIAEMKPMAKPDAVPQLSLPNKTGKSLQRQKSNVGQPSPVAGSEERMLKRRDSKSSVTSAGSRPASQQMVVRRMKRLGTNNSMASMASINSMASVASSKGGRSQRSGGGRRTGRSSRQPSRPESAAIEEVEEEKPPPSIGVDDLEHQLSKHPDAVPRPTRSAQEIVWLLGADPLLTAHFHGIFSHHRLRVRNFNSRVQLRLTLVQHGVAAVGHGGRPGGGAADTGAGQSERPEAPWSPSSPAKELAPEGWAQVTRTAWQMRLLPREYAPAVVLTASPKCCAQTADRLRTLSDDADAPSDCERPPPKPHPEACGCAALDFPGLASPGIAPMVYSLTQEVARAVRATESEHEETQQAGDAPALMLVAGGAALEALIACLNAGLSSKERDAHMAIGRLGGGDAVLLESPVILRIVGDTEDDEHVRSPSELWEKGFQMPKWRVVRHVTGDGRLSWGERPKSADSARSASDDAASVAEGFSETRHEWASYLGQPLVLSHGDFMELCKRAGSQEYPMEKTTLARLRPLVNDTYRPFQMRKFA